MMLETRVNEATKISTVTSGHRRIMTPGGDREEVMSKNMHVCNIPDDLQDKIPHVTSFKLSKKQ